jgi:thiamine-phosphate pyrophosphorylase
MTAPQCRLFLVTPEDGEPKALAACLQAALHAGSVAALLIRHNGGADAVRAVAASLMPLAQTGGVAVLLDEAPELAVALGADGVQVAGSLERYLAAREILGGKRIVGALAGASRHGAMELGEAGADYLAFRQATAAGADEEPLIAWWAALIEVPCVAFDPVAAEAAAALAAQGIDFVRPEEAMWQSAAAARQTIGALNAMLTRRAQA